MIGKLSVLRHVVVGGAVLGCGALAYAGLIGSPRPTERYAQWQIVIEPAQAPAIDVTETIDYDMADNERRGVRRLLPNDFGQPTDITATAVDAPDNLYVGVSGADTEVRIGDRNITLNGEHRYELAYRYPDARYGVGERLAVDLTGNLELPITVLRGTLNGFRLSDTACYYGDLGSTDTCEITEIDDGMYQVELHDVKAREFVTIEGTVEEVMVEPRQVAIEPPIVVKPPNRAPIAVAVIISGALVSVMVFVFARFRGRNVVYSGGPTDAALAPPAQGVWAPPGQSGAAAAPPATMLVSDAGLADLATTEFVPPPGVAPWEGAVALTERLDDSTLRAYVSGLASAEAITFQPDGKKLMISAGPRLAEAGQFDQQWVQELLAIENPFVTGKYNKKFAKLMSNTQSSLTHWIQQRQWWRRGGPTGSGASDLASSALKTLFTVIFLSAFWGGAGFFAFAGLLGVASNPVVAVILTAIVCGIIAFLAYSILLPSRSAAGSAVAIQTESFRRFLHASEAQHVEWAWQQGLLREYSAWAVALGEADAWSKALNMSTVPPNDMSLAPLYTYSFASSLTRSSTKPSSSGGGGGGGSSGGGFSGGGSAGGGGGGGGGGGW